MRMRKTYGAFILSILASTLLVGCAGMQQAAAPQWYFGDVVTADVVAQYAKLPPPPNVWLVDVRPKAAYDEGHIFSSFNIPADTPGELKRLLPKNKKIELIFYCDGPACETSHQAARAAQKLGYPNANVFAGGVESWKKSYELVALGKKAVAQGFGIVDYDYVLAKVGKGTHRLNKVVIIDARPDRMYSAGHIPSAISLPSMTFSRDYPEFEKRNIAKGTEIILGIGRECPLSLKNAERLKEKGYTNLKLYIAPPVWHGTGYLEIDAAMAKKLKDKGAPFLDARPERLFKKGTIDGALNIPVTQFDDVKNRLPADKSKPVVSFCQGYKCARSHELALKMRAIGYQQVVVYAGGYPEWKQQYAMAKANVQSGKEEGTINIAAFEKILMENPESVRLIDVRSAAEYSTGTFKTALNISVDDLEKQVKTLPTDKPIVFVCATGARSGEAYYMIRDLRPELKNVYFLDAEVDYHKDGSYKITPPQ